LSLLPILIQTLLGKILGFSFKNSILGQLQKVGADSRTKAALQGATGSTLGEYQNNAANNARAAAAKKQAADALAAQKAITDQKAKQLKLDQAALSLKLAGNTTDMQNIEIQAALQRGQNEEVTNVLLLQRAILSGNADQANVLAQQVLKANGLVMDVNGNISSLAGAKDPFKDWPASTSAAMAQLKAIQDAIAAIKDKTITVTVNTISNGSASTGGVSAFTPLTPSNPDPAAVIAQHPEIFGTPAPIPSSVVSTATGMFPDRNFGTSTSQDDIRNGGGSSTPVAVTVVLNGQTVGNAITSAQVDNSASGIPSSFQRSGFGSGALPW